MQKYVFHGILAGLFLLLAGCQNGASPLLYSNPTGNIFGPQSFTLTQAVQDALAGTGDPVLARVIVQSEGRVVLLRGYVKKIRQSDTAEMIARKVPGVENVENQIVVRP